MAGMLASEEQGPPVPLLSPGSQPLTCGSPVQILCSNIIAAKRVQLPNTFSLLLLTQLFRKGESLSNQPYGVQFYLPW